MNTLLTVILAGAAVGAGVFLLVRQVVPGVPALGKALERLNNDPVPPLVIAENADLAAKVGARLQRRVPTSGSRLFQVSDADLEILGRQRYEVLGEKLVSALIGFLIGPFTTLVGTLGGVGVGYLLPTVFSLVFAAAGWFVPDLAAREKAASARVEYASSASAYLDLVAIARVSGMGANEAMRSAAQITGNAAFRRIAQAIQRSSWAGTPPWDALADLRSRLDVPELGDVADIMRLTGSGGQVIESLRHRAASLRDAQLTADHARAKSQSERLTLAMSTTGLLFLLMLLYPAASTMLA